MRIIILNGYTNNAVQKNKQEENEDKSTRTKAAETSYFFRMKQIPQLGKLLGTQIREARKAIPGLSQEKLADALGTERAYISRLERGVIVPSVGVFLLLGEVLKIPASSLLTRIEDDLAQEIRHELDKN